MKKLMLLVGVFIVAASVLSLHVPSGAVHATGPGGGTGGSGGGGGGCGSVGPCTTDGWTWAWFDISGFNPKGPSYIFGNGTDLSSPGTLPNGSQASWPGIVQACLNDQASQVYAFVIPDDTGATGIYSFTPGLSTNSGGTEIPIGTYPVDSNGSGHAVDNNTAQKAFYKFKNTYGSNLQWNQNVGWFCASFPSNTPPPTVDASSGVSPTSGTSNFDFTHNVNVNGNSSTNPATYQYTVMGVYCHDGGVNPNNNGGPPASNPNCGTPSVSGCGSLAPGCPNLPSGSQGNASVNGLHPRPLYQFPGAAQQYDQYCQLMYVNPISPTKDTGNDISVGGVSAGNLPNGFPTGGWYSDNGVCVTYTPQPPRPTYPDINAITSLSPGNAATGYDIPPGSATFTHWVSADPSNSATYTYGAYYYQVQGMYCAGGATGIGGVVSCASGSGTWGATGCGSLAPGCPTLPNGGLVKLNNGTSSSPITYTYNFPSNATPGDAYCQRLEVEPNPGGVTTDTHDNGPVSSWYYDNGQCVTYDPPTCSISIGPEGNIPGDSNPNDVVAGGQYAATVTITNHGSNGTNITSVTWSGASSDTQYVSQSVGNHGGQTSVPDVLIAPNSPGSYTLYATVTDDANPQDTISCNTGPNLQPYQYFSYVPNPTATLDDPQDPTVVNKTYTISPGPNNPSTVPTPSESDSLYFVPGGSSTQTTVETDSGTGSWTYTITQPVKAGNQYCPVMTVNPGNGYIGPGGALQDVNPVTVTGACATIVNDPYYKIFGSGVTAGGGFSSSGTCNGGGELAGWNNDSGTNPNYDFGSSAQLTAQALTDIVGFASAQRANPTRAPNDLSLANTGSGVSNTPDPYNPVLGGNFNYSQPCFPELPTPTSATNFTGSSVSGLTGAQSYTANGPITLGGGTVATGTNATLFVKGDVYITSDITYAGASGGSGGWSINNSTDTTNIPSLAIIATGNIYIDPSVTELDGLYIADGSAGGSGTEGSIYTCATGFQPVLTSQYGTCQNQLVVNGAFEANNIDLMRTFGSLRDEKNGAPALSSPQVCSNAPSGYSSWPSDIPSNERTCAAEIFNFSPEMYISSWAATPLTGAVGQWTSVTSLPPVL